MKRLIVAAIEVVVAAAVAAQSVPGLVNYQGRLTDAAGQPLVTGDYRLTFKIYNDPTAAGDCATSPVSNPCVWGPLEFDREAGQALSAGHKYKVPVVQGYLNVMLGEVDTQSRSILNAFQGPNRYIEIAVNGGAPILPRQQILSAPYAVTAADVRGSENLFPGSGGVGIGTTTPASPLHVVGGGSGGYAVEIDNPTGDGYGLRIRASDGAGSGKVLDVASAQGTSMLSIAEDGTLDVSRINVKAQKALITGCPNNWTSWGIVPNSWTKEAARIWAASGLGCNYTLVCIYETDFSKAPTSTLVGSQDAPSPPDNRCGW